MGALRDWALGRPDGTPWLDGGPVPALPAGPGPPSGRQVHQDARGPRAAAPSTPIYSFSKETPTITQIRRR